MTVANVTAKRVSDDMIFQATGDTPFDFTGLGSGVEYDVTMPDGTVLRRTTLAAADLNFIASTQAINNGNDQTIYTSPVPFTPDASTNLIIALVSCYSAASAANEVVIDLDGAVFVSAFSSIIQGGGGRSLAVHYLTGADIRWGQARLPSRVFSVQYRRACGRFKLNL